MRDWNLVKKRHGREVRLVTFILIICMDWKLNAVLDSEWRWDSKDPETSPLSVRLLGGQFLTSVLLTWRSTILNLTEKTTTTTSWDELQHVASSDLHHQCVKVQRDISVKALLHECAIAIRLDFRKTFHFHCSFLFSVSQCKHHQFFVSWLLPNVSIYLYL